MQTRIERQSDKLTHGLYSCLCLQPHLIVPPHLVSVFPSSIVCPTDRGLGGSTYDRGDDDGHSDTLARTFKDKSGQLPHGFGTKVNALSGSNNSDILYLHTHNTCAGVHGYTHCQEFHQAKAQAAAQLLQGQRLGLMEM